MTSVGTVENKIGVYTFKIGSFTCLGNWSSGLRAQPELGMGASVSLHVDEDLHASWTTWQPGGWVLGVNIPRESYHSYDQLQKSYRGISALLFSQGNHKDLPLFEEREH